MRAAPAARPSRLALLAIVIVPVASHCIILATRHVHLGTAVSFGALFKLGFVTVSALVHWGIYVSLLGAFAFTLRPGHEPLISGMARRMHGPLTTEMLVYTRKVTVAWSLFFAAQLAISIGLFCAAPLVWWSFFVNILDLPLIAMMFAAEYAIRLRVLKNPPRDSLSAIVAMVASCFPGPEKHLAAKPEPP